jgi:hypothetical protein
MLRKNKLFYSVFVQQECSSPIFSFFFAVDDVFAMAGLPKSSSLKSSCTSLKNKRRQLIATKTLHDSCKFYSEAVQKNHSLWKHVRENSNVEKQPLSEDVQEKSQIEIVQRNSRRIDVHPTSSSSLLFPSQLYSAAYENHTNVLNPTEQREMIDGTHTASSSRSLKNRVYPSIDIRAEGGGLQNFSSTMFRGKRFSFTSNNVRKKLKRPSSSRKNLESNHTEDNNDIDDVKL